MNNKIGYKTFFAIRNLINAIEELDKTYEYADVRQSDDLDEATDELINAIASIAIEDYILNQKELKNKKESV